MSESPGQHQPAGAASPGDVHAARSTALRRLDALVGHWEMEASFAAGFLSPGNPAAKARGGRTTFEWLTGEFFLIQRVTVDDPAAPSGIAIIGVDDAPGLYSQHYYDSRGVARVYQMSLHDDTWRLWREAPGFWQRYKGVFSDGGRIIEGAWERSADGSRWEHDFGLSYIKVE
jgi:hypothetical protein